MAMLDAAAANLALEPIRADLAATRAMGRDRMPGRPGGLCPRPRGWAAATAMAASGRHHWRASSSHPLRALAPGPLTLISPRFLQGLAGGLMVPAVQALVRQDRFGSPRRPAHRQKVVPCHTAGAALSGSGSPSATSSDRMPSRRRSRRRPPPSADRPDDRAFAPPGVRPRASPPRCSRCGGRDSRCRGRRPACPPASARSGRCW